MTKNEVKQTLAFVQKSSYRQLKEYVEKSEPDVNFIPKCVPNRIPVEHGVTVRSW